MLTEEQYGNELGARLRDEMQDVRASPDLARKLRRQQAKRTWAIRSVIAVPVAAAAVAAVMVATTTTTPNTPSEANKDTNSVPVQDVPVETVAHVQAETLKAVGEASQYVIQTKSTYDEGHYDQWVDKATQRYRNDVYSRSVTTRLPPGERQPGGRMTLPAGSNSVPLAPIHLNQSHAVSGPDGNQDIMTVDYDLKTWFTGHVKDPKPKDIPDITDAESIRKAIADGTLELVGKEKVDGFDTLHLRLFGPKRSYRIDMWVDSKTYLPVRDTAAKSGKSGGEEFPASATVTTKYTWLPRSDENLARLVLTPPPGFEKTN